MTKTIDITLENKDVIKDTAKQYELQEVQGKVYSQNLIEDAFINPSNQQNLSQEYLKSNYGTPVMLVTKNGKLVKTFEGYAPMEKYIEFFEENGVL